MNNLKRYVQDRLSTIRPSPTEDELVYPWTLLGKLTWKNWKYFLLGYFAWSWDAFDFHSVTLSYPDFQHKFGHGDLTKLSLAVTLTLMTRPIGGAIFGMLSDKFGRKWPFIGNCVLLIVFVLGTGFCETYEQFVAVRALFGCAMGGIYGNAAATALEDIPAEARGLMSGVYQSGYPTGYVLAVIFYKAFHNTPSGWRTLFWFGAGVPVLLIIYRLCLDETDAWYARERFRTQKAGIKDIGSEVGGAIVGHWQRIMYLVFLLMGMMYLSHGTQDIYPYLLRYKYRNLFIYDPIASKYVDDAVVSKITTIQTVANLGGMIGGICTGYASQILGRRLAFIVICFVGGLLLYPYTFTTGDGIHAAAFFEQFCVQGGWSIVPIHLIELSPAGFRTFIVGTSYQTASLLASASNTILIRMATLYPQPEDADQQKKPINTDDFRIPVCIFTGCFFVYVAVMAALGPERRGRDMITDDSDNEADAPWGIQGKAVDMPNAKV